MVDIVKLLEEMDKKSKANIAATKRRQQPLKDTGHGFKARGYVEDVPTHEQIYPGHRKAAQEAGVGGIAKFFTPEHKKWIAGNRAQMSWLPKEQPKYYGEDWRRLRKPSQGEGGVSMAAQYPRVVRTDPPSLQEIERQPNERAPSLQQLQPQQIQPQPQVIGGGPRVSDPMNTRPGTFMGSLHHPPSIVGMRPRTEPQLQVIPDRNILSRQPNERVPSLQQPQFIGRHPPRPPWSAGQTNLRLPNQRVPSKAQVTVTQEQGKPDKKVTKYDIGQDDTLGVTDQGRASSEYQIQGMLRRAMDRSDREEQLIRDAMLSGSEAKGRVLMDQQAILGRRSPSVGPGVMMRNTLPAGGVRPFTRQSGIPEDTPIFGGPLPPPRRERNPFFRGNPMYDVVGNPPSVGERLRNAGLGRSASMRKAYERQPRYGLQSHRGWARGTPYPNPYYDFYGMLGRNEY